MAKPPTSVKIAAMTEVGPLLTAVLGANFLTLMFVYGLREASKAYRDEDISWIGILSILIPMAFMGGGILIYAV